MTLASKKKPRPPRRSARVAAPARPQAPWPILGIAVVLGVAPLFRGLYFTGEQLVVAMAVVALVLWEWGLRFARGNKRWISQPVDWAFLGLIAAYLISTFFAANFRNAVQSDILDGTAFLVFWMAGEHGKDPLGRRAILWSIVAAGAITAFIGVGSGTHWFSYPGAFVTGRVYTTFQYPDAAAAYLAAGFLCALFLAGTMTQRGWRFGISAVAAFLAATFVLCLSRGALLVLPVAIAVFVVLQQPGQRIRALLQVVFTFLPAAGAAAVALSPLGKGSSVAWVWLLAGVVIAAALEGLVATLRPKVQLGILAVGILLLAASPVVVLRHGSGLLARLGHLSLSSYNAWSRVRWTEDALRIFRDHPITGLGGGGWAAAFQHYQSYGYFSTQVHDFFAQTLVEAGALGGICLLAIVVFLVLGTVRGWRAAAPEERAFWAAVAGALAMLGLHSAIDFTFSLGGALLAGAALTGLLRGNFLPWERAKTPTTPPRWHRKMAQSMAGPATATFAVGVGVFAFLAILYGGFTVGQRAVRDAQAHQVAPAMTLYKEAMGLDPFQASLRADLAQLTYLQASHPTLAEVNTAAQLFQQAIAFDRFNPQIHRIYGDFLLQTGKIPAGLAQLHQALADAPFNTSMYGAVAQADVQVAEAELNAHQAATADNALRDVARVASQLQRNSKSVPAVARKRFPTPATTPNLQLAQGQADAMLSRWQPAVALLGHLVGGSNKAVAGTSAAWLSVTYQAMGSSAKASKAASQSAHLLGSKQAKNLMQSVKKWVNPAA